MLRFTVLAVCTGNVCRSPSVERLLRAGLGPGSAVRVSSAGLGALVGRGIDAPTAQALAARGADTDGFVARQLSPELVEEADLVLTATRSQRSQLVALAPAAVRRTYAVREFARLVSLGGPGAPSAQDEAERWSQLLLLAERNRRPPSRPEDDDVADPHGRRARHHRAAVAQLEEAVTAILAAVGAVGARR